MQNIMIQALMESKCDNITLFKHITHKNSENSANRFHHNFSANTPSSNITIHSVTINAIKI